MAGRYLNVSRIALLLGVLLLVCRAGAHTKAGCEDGWTPMDSQCVKRMRVSQSWSDAQNTCNGYSSTLVEPDTLIKNNVLFRLGMQPGESVWLGLRRNDSDATFRWVSIGNAMDKTRAPLYHGEPNGGKMQQCMLRWPNGQWLDESCSMINSVICQKERGFHRLCGSNTSVDHLITKDTEYCISPGPFKNVGQDIWLLSYGAAFESASRARRYCQTHHTDLVNSRDFSLQSPHRGYFASLRAMPYFFRTNNDPNSDAAMANFKFSLGMYPNLIYSLRFVTVCYGLCRLAPGSDVITIHQTGYFDCRQGFLPIFGGQAKCSKGLWNARCTPCPVSQQDAIVSYKTGTDYQCKPPLARMNTERSLFCKIGRIANIMCHVPPKCTLPNIQNAHVTRLSKPERYAISCNSGYKLTNVLYDNRCNATLGAYRNVPKCVISLKCTLPNIQNAQVTRLSKPERYAISCNSGYELTNVLYDNLCDAQSGTYRNVPECVLPPKCTLPNIQNAQVTRLSKPERYAISCNSGYELTNVLYDNLCDAQSSTYRNVPECVPKYCPDGWNRDKGCMKLSKSSYSRADASTHCTKEGGSLARTDSGPRGYWASSLLGSNDAWIGLSGAPLQWMVGVHKPNDFTRYKPGTFSARGIFLTMASGCHDVTVKAIHSALSVKVHQCQSTAQNRYLCEKTCPIGWHATGRVCLLDSGKDMTNDEAQKYCATKGGMLPRTDDAYADKAVYDFQEATKIRKNAWIGMRSHSSTLQWDIPRSGSSKVHYANFGGHPVHAKQCITMHSTDGRWKSEDCTDRNHVFCEKVCRYKDTTGKIFTQATYDTVCIPAGSSIETGKTVSWKTGVKKMVCNADGTYRVAPYSARNKCT